MIRQVLTVLGTALVAKGYVQATDIEPVMGALLTIGSEMIPKRLTFLEYLLIGLASAVCGDRLLNAKGCKR